MGRLEQVRQKRLKKNILLYAAVLVAVIIFVSTLGFRLLLSASTYVADIFSKNDTVTLTKNDDLIGIITIDNIPIATNSATIIVSGSVVNFEKLRFYLNDEMVKETVTEADSFSEEIGDLKKGDNVVFVEALNTVSKSRRKTIDHRILFRDEKPKLEITEPQDKANLSASEVILKGATDKETFVRVNDGPIVVDAVGNFQSTIRLKEGENQIIVTATDLAGNLESKSITVIYQKE